MLAPHLHPKAWPTWIGLGIFRVLILLPWPILMRIGALFGRAIWVLLPSKRRRVMETNLECCFPELSNEERKILGKQHVESMGKGFLEVALAWWGKDDSLSKRLVSLNGLEHLHKAQAQGDGVILLSAHFTSLEVGGRLLLQHTSLDAMYRPGDDAAVAYMMFKKRTQHAGKAIPKDDIKSVIRSLRQGHIVWYAPDQSPAKNNGVFAPFFGIETLTNTATSRLAKLTGARIVPFLPLRRKDGTGYDLQLFAPLDDFPSGNDREDATRINALFEHWIRQQPEEYFWFHRRFKQQPDEKPGLYT